jgi:catechol 2,3-dioxygenase-like lactoylglutathione lyase family enzyme
MGIRWTHLTITVADIDRTVRFYSGTCRLSIVRDRRKEGGATVWMGPPAAAGRDPAFVLVLQAGVVTARLDHLGFQCGSRAEVDAVAAEGKERGSLLEGPVEGGGTVGYWATLLDPDGHVVEFTHGQPLEGLA